MLLASLLHDFYLEAEKIFPEIAVKIDQDRLLVKVGTFSCSKDGENVNRRDSAFPSDIDESLKMISKIISSLASFRNIYGFELKMGQMPTFSGEVKILLSRNWKNKSSEF